MLIFYAIVVMRVKKSAQWIFRPLTYRKEQLKKNIMPDISKCANENCPSKMKCFRYTAKPNEYRQSYADFSPNEGEDRCEYFWNN